MLLSLGDVLQPDRPEPGQQRGGLAVERHQTRRLHPVAAGELAYQELAIGANHEFVRIELACGLQPIDDRLVLGHVVGGDTEGAAHHRHRPFLSLLVEHSADRGRPGVAPGRTVGIEDVPARHQRGRRITARRCGGSGRSAAGPRRAPRSAQRVTTGGGTPRIPHRSAVRSPPGHAGGDARREPPAGRAPAGRCRSCAPLWRRSRRR